jgi:RNA polymerase sigma-70 factor (ECF subfamily)
MDLSIQPYLTMPDGIGDTTDEGPCSDGRIVLRDCLTANYGRLHRRLSGYLGCSDRASDCLHDAWLRLGDTTMPAAVRHPEAYVYRVACNLAMDDLRGNRARQCVGDAGTELEHLADPSPGPDRVAEARLEVAAMARAIRQLPRRHQAILMALRLDELTRHEVAARHGLSLRCVDTALRQALDYCTTQINGPRGASRAPRSPGRSAPACEGQGASRS